MYMYMDTVYVHVVHVCTLAYEYKCAQGEKKKITGSSLVLPVRRTHFWHLEST